MSGGPMLLTTDAVGGVWNYTLALAAGLSARGRRCTLAVLGPSPDAAQAQDAAAFEVIDTGLPLDWTAASPDALSFATSRLAALAREVGASGVHLHSPALAAADFDAPVVAVAHSCVATWWSAVGAGCLPPDFGWRRTAMARGMDAAAAVVAPSHAFAAALLDTYGYAAHVVHNGLAAASAPSLPRQRRVLAAGRLWDTGKGMALLDAAAALLDAPVLAAGPLQGPGGAAFAPRHLRPLGTLAGAALQRAYAEAAVFASPALYEPFGLAVLEAAQAGTPLVLSDIAAFRELWDGAALFVPSREPAEWASGLRRVLDDPALQATLGARARQRAGRYDLRSMVDATLAIHDSL